jgi:SAM-dependent methyltransferase
MAGDNNICSCSFDFETRHEYLDHPAMRELERDVLGCDYGGTSWTTRDQADQIPGVLGLSAGSELLEIGAGTGWPGVYTAGISGCNITMLDLPLSALKHASERACQEGLGENSIAVVGSGSELPFADETFDAIAHSDVLCCLPEKLAMLRECRRVAIDGAPMLFYVIAPVSGLNPIDQREAEEAGPPFVGVDGTYGELLEQSGWEVLDRTDLSTEYLGALQRLLKGMRSREETLKVVMGREEFSDHISMRQRQVQALSKGLLEREVIHARAA